jgi:hypothetical protein
MLVHRGLALGLDLATTSQDEEKATSMIDRRIELGGDHPSWPVAEVRWWRTRRDHERAVESAAGTSRDGYDGARLAVELGRTHLDAGAFDAMRSELRRAIEVCRARGFKELATLAHLVLGVVDEDPGWSSVVDRALSSRWVELSLAALELDGRRQLDLGNPGGARERFQTLQARALDLHQRHYAAAAERWLDAAAHAFPASR